MNREELLQTKGYWVAKIQIELYTYRVVEDEIRIAKCRHH
jgi:Txe/YoeB family toxin of Txe-Axe toxin-antitoxin module